MSHNYAALMAQTASFPERNSLMTPLFVPPDDVFSRLSSPRVNVTTDHRGEDDFDLDVGLGLFPDITYPARLQNVARIWKNGQNGRHGARRPFLPFRAILWSRAGYIKNDFDNQ